MLQLPAVWVARRLATVQMRCIGMREKVTPVTAWHGAMWNHFGEAELGGNASRLSEIGCSHGIWSRNFRHRIEPAIVRQRNIR
jgi:hypothetical protein